jgi:23S rRNA (uracil747-C5)-methyltransferase
VNTFCPYYNRQECKSCTWIEIPYADQLVKKENAVPSNPIGFRNRAKMIVTGTSEKPVIGLTGETDLDEGRELLHCPIQHPKLNEVIAALPDYIHEFNLIPYQIENRKGELKALILFYSPLTNQMYLRFILRSKECVSRIIKLLPKLQTQFPHLVCVTANIQPIAQAILEGKEEIFITEQKFIEHQLGHLTLNLAPQAFVQTNAEVATKLYQMAADWITEIKPEKMLELFCGQGAFSLFAAKSAKKILGIEINEDAVKTANETAQKLGYTHLSFECRDAAFAPSIGADLILVNPPRRGLGESIQILLNAKPEHLIYSSCSAESLNKDLLKLSEHYSVIKKQVFDLFPHTEHFETLVHLQRKATS